MKVVDQGVYAILKNFSIKKLEKQLTPHQAYGFLVDIYVGMYAQARSLDKETPEQSPSKVYREALKTLSKDIEIYKKELGIK
ncbi:MAG: hypothetical protein NHB14_27290 [Desulfosporosinus sp.]|nr:hypothetical protein [Methanosarcina sp. ERenArc_MAG2]MCO5388867.1 hypothetical protein [Desulfosporosinus sp.]